MITKICLVVIFVCLSTFVLSRRIRIAWVARLVMCCMMINCIAMLAVPKHYDVAHEMFFVGLAFIFSLGTKFLHERGGYK